MIQGITERQVVFAVFILWMTTIAALAQGDGDAPPTESVQWLKYVAMAITAVVVPALVEVLKKFWPKAPAAVKQVSSLVAGSLLMAAAAALSNLLGAPVDFSELINFLTTGGGLGLAATVGFGAGKRS